MISSRGTVSGLAQRTAHRRIFKPQQRRGVAMIYGATGTRDSWFNWDDAYRAIGLTGEITGITDAGFPLGSIDTLDLWGNDTHQANTLQLRENCQADWGGFRFHYIGTSAGGLNGLNLLVANPDLLRSVSILIPVLDVQDVYDNNRESFASVISSAYGGRPPDSHNPMSNLEAIAATGVPIKLWASTSDSVTPWSITEEFVDTLGDQVELVNMGALGHNWNYTYWNPESIVEFLEAHD